MDSTGATDNAWNADDKCTATGNWIKLDAAAYTLDTTDKFTWTINGLGNPEAALSRTAHSLGEWDFDATDTALFGTTGSWTEKFALFTFDVSDKGYTARSYGNLNAGYLGFSYKYDRIEVNSGNRIKVWAGSYTTNNSIKASTNGGMMAAEKVTLSPSSNVRSLVNPDTKIAYTSAEDFVFFSATNEINFRVGADINLSKGIYYIDWSITET